MRGCVVILVDESRAMDTEISKESRKSKAAGLATAINSLLNRMTKGVDADVAVVGFRCEGDNVADVGCRWAGPLADSEFVPTSQLASSPVETEQRTRGLPGPGDQTFDFPVSYRPTTGGNAPHVAAMEYCQQLISKWADAQGSEAGQPLVINLFAGSSSDGNPMMAAQDLMKMELPGGSPLVCQVHIASTGTSAVPALLYPSERKFITLGPAKELYDRSSVLPESLREALTQAKVRAYARARGMIYNSRLVDIARLLGLVETHVAEVAAVVPQVETPPADVPISPEGPGEQPGEPSVPPAAPEGEDLPADLPAPATDLPEPLGGETEPGGAPLEPAVNPTGLPQPMGDPGVVIDDPAVSMPEGESLPAAPKAAGPALAPISPDQPALVLLVVDRSLADPYGTDPMNACTRLCAQMGDMVEMVAKFGAGSVDLGVVTYGADSTGETDVRATLEGGLAGRPYARDNELRDNAVRTEDFTEEISDGAGGILPVPHSWPILVEIEPTLPGPATPAFDKAAETVSVWLQEHPAAANPPLVVHLTRGQVDLAELEAAVAQLQATSSATPPVLYHIVETEEEQRPLLFPADEAAIEDPQLLALWRLSSPLLGREQLAVDGKPGVTDQSRGFVVNTPGKLMLEALKSVAPSEDAW